MSDITFLFDLDGTLVDTDALHLNAYNTLLARWQRSIDLDYYKTHLMGFPDDMIFGGLFPGMPAAEFTKLAAEKERLFRAQLGARLTPTAGTEALLDRIARAGLRSAVVTNAPRENARMMLEALGLGAYFETLVIGGELAHGKPHPLPYLTALESIGGDAAHAVAFEDSASGVRSASSAGIHTFGMRTALDDAQLREAGAHDTIRDFSDPRLEAWLARAGI
ncbi:HAD family hydrolase [Burkholderia gladioli]|uniref:HAD family hydrolase n=1 Tax=Burkholderia gladioli TaxID=28095 RepID=UPI0013649B58|nr:HAD-IA family hydrolase [Burkholderia gladioli]KAF1060441.1 Phosphorylated carbohydrates phosphatase [Burkholderia gladioli]MDN7494098.1 HAD-IA family hydrolase [Burkholderia gladioli]WAG24449.1 HAD family hydrolase [Burkholderia gladioli]